MAKVQQKSEKITAFGGIFFVLDRFDRILSSVIDSHLGLRSKLIGYQYSEIIRAVFSVFCCGGDCMEDLNLWVAAGTDSGIGVSSPKMRIGNGSQCGFRFFFCLAIGDKGTRGQTYKKMSRGSMFVLLGGKE